MGTLLVLTYILALDTGKTRKLTTIPNLYRHQLRGKVVHSLAQKKLGVEITQPLRAGKCFVIIGVYSEIFYSSGFLSNGYTLCPTFESLDRDGNDLITAEEAAELDIGWIMGDGGQIDREEWEAIKTEVKNC